MTSVLGGAARSSGLSFLGSLISAVAGFALSLVLARTLGPSGSGIVFQMISIFTIAGAFAKLGLDTTAVWLLPRLNADLRADERRAIAILLLGALGGGIVTGLVVFLVAPLLSNGSDDLVHLTRVAALFMPFSSVSTVALAVTRGLGGIRNYVLIGSIGLPIGRLAAVYVAASFLASALVAGVAWLGMLVLATAAALLGVQRAARRLRRGPDSPRPWMQLAKPIAAFGAPRTLSSGIEQALMWLDVLIVGLIAGASSAGVYAVVSRLIQAGTIPSTSMRIVVAPQFSRMLHTRRIRALTQLYSRTAQWIVLLSMPIYVLLTVLADPVLRIFGPGFEDGALALAVMSIGAIVSASTGNVQSLLLMSGRSGWAAINKIIVLNVMLTLLLTLVPLWGILGGALASTVAVSLDAVLATVQVRRSVRIRSNIPRVLLAILVAGAATAVPAVAARIVLGDSALALIAGTISAVILWAVAIYLTRGVFALDRASALLSRRGHHPPTGSDDQAA